MKREVTAAFGPLAATTPQQTRSTDCPKTLALPTKHLATVKLSASYSHRLHPLASRSRPLTPARIHAAAKQNRVSPGGTHPEKPCAIHIILKSIHHETRTLIATHLPPSSRYVTSALAPTCNFPSTVVFLSIWKVIVRCVGSCSSWSVLDIVWLGPIFRVNEVF